MVTAEEWALAACVVCSGLWSGLLGMLTLVMHPMLSAMDGRDFARFLRAFLPFGRKAWLNYACALGMGIAPIVALVTLWDDRGARGLSFGRDRAEMTVPGPHPVQFRRDRAEWAALRSAMPTDGCRSVRTQLLAWA